MRISSSDVEAVKFAVTLRGYAEDEVDAFLDLVAATIGEYELRDVSSRGEIDRLRVALDECREARLAEIAPAGSLTDRSGEVQARIHDMLEGAARTSERVVEEALEAAEHVLDQVRSVMADSSTQAKDQGSDSRIRVDEGSGSALAG